MVTFKAMSSMHVFKDYVVIELWMKLVHELVGKEKGMKEILWRHANKDTHIDIWARHAYA